METNFRSIAGTKPEVIRSAFNLPTNPLVIIDNGNTELAVTYYVNKLEDKLQAITNRTEDQIILFAWVGKYRTDVFELTDDDIKLITE